MSQIFYVILGLSIIVATNWGVTLALVYFYFFVAKVSEPVSYKLKLSLWLSLANLLAQFLGLIIFTSGGVLLYSVITFILSMGGYLAVMRLGYKYHMLENLIIATSLSVILNPIWLNLFGIL